jgi:hypothetical protein
MPVVVATIDSGATFSDGTIVLLYQGVAWLNWRLICEATALGPFLMKMLVEIPGYQYLFH